LSVFDDWIHEPAYLCGLIAGSLTKSDILGVVGARPVPEVNRLISAFRRGAREVNPKVEVKTAFIDSWYDPPRARAAARDLIKAGADLVYAERMGAIQACREARIPAFGNLEDQNYLGRDTVITSPTWDMGPTVKKVIESVRDDNYLALDLAAWSMMARGGAYLASYHGFAGRLPAEVKELVAARRGEIISGAFRVPINEESPCH
jgi:basic membrane lipoprotein Med (substrate-binding protein (PBP1-ABC) superfamily)